VRFLTFQKQLLNRTRHDSKQESMTVMEESSSPSLKFYCIEFTVASNGRSMDLVSYSETRMFHDSPSQDSLMYVFC
jgi:hypothetical protein